MPTFEVTQYCTYADRFTVTASSPKEAYDLMRDWYNNRYEQRPRLLPDADVAPRVQLLIANDYVDLDGARAIGPDEEEMDFD